MAYWRSIAVPTRRRRDSHLSPRRSNEAELLAHCRATAATAARNLAAAATKAREQAVTKDSEMGEIIQLSGDQRTNVNSFLVDQEICLKSQVVIHGF